MFLYSNTAHVEPKKKKRFTTSFKIATNKYLGSGSYWEKQRKKSENTDISSRFLF